MQINIDKKTGILISIIGILSLALVFLLFTNIADRGNFNRMGMHHEYQEGNRSDGPSARFLGNEVMFAQMMIPHHEQAVLMSGYAISASKDPEILTLAKNIRDAQTVEIKLMKSWLKKSDAPRDMGHDMGMNGMLTNFEVAELKKAQGRTFDLLFLQGMIEHHEGALHMVQMIEDSTNFDVKKLHDDIVRTQSAEIETMKGILARLGA